MPWLLFFFFLLSGVCYAQQDPGTDQQRSSIIEKDPTTICAKKFAGDPRFSPIANKLALVETRDTSFEMLANQTLASKKEQEAIAEWVNARKECVKAGDAYHRQNYHPQLIALLIEGENNVGAIAADLYNRKLTYGAFNKRRQSITDDLRNKVSALGAQIKAQREAAQQAQQTQQQTQDAQKAAQERDAAAQNAALEQARQAQQAQRDLEAQRARQHAELQAQQQAQQADAARRQAAMQMLMRQNQPTPLVPYHVPVRPSTNTNCYQVGNQWNCTTQ